MVPCLRTHAHAAAGALLIFRAGQPRAARGGQAVKAGQQVRRDGLAQSGALGIQRSHLLGILFAASCHAGLSGLQSCSQLFHLRAGRSQRNFVGFGALQAGELFVFQPAGLAGLKLNFVVDGCGLRGRGHGVNLRTEAIGLLAMRGNLPLQPRAQRLLVVERRRDFSGAALGSLQIRLSPRNLGGQLTQFVMDARTLQFNGLQLGELFDLRFHLCQQVYAIHLPLRKPARYGAPAKIEDRWRARMQQKPASPKRRSRWLRWLGGSALAGVGVAATVVSALLHRAEPYLRARIVAALEQKFHARVELDSFHVSLLEGLRAEGKGLRIWPPQQMLNAAPADTATQKPLIQLAEFRFHAALRYRPGVPIHIAVVQLHGLQVDLPPRARLRHAAPDAQTNAVQNRSAPGSGLVQFQVGAVECTDAHLTLETDKPGKLPLQIAIARLHLTGVSAGLSGAMGFQAELTNPRPVGTIHAEGQFGPWVVDDPGESPLAGAYTFEHADLSTFHGIAGMLHSTGRYQGTLRNLTVDGATDTPDFRLTAVGHAMPLHTTFHARVDATNGDTWLEPVEATLGGSHVTARGKVVRQLAANGHPGGHEIALDVTVNHGRIQDFLQLTGRAAQPLLSGTLATHAALEIPPGPVPVMERMRLKGNFSLQDAQFTSEKIQDKIAQLSLRGQGRPGDLGNPGAEAISSTMQSDFTMADAVVTLPNLRYTVPGAEIDLKGSYGIEDERLNFAGVAKMQAHVSQMVGGWKGLLLKPLDRYFSKDGAGTEVPVHIRGTRTDPDIGVDFGRLKKSSPQRPDTSSQ